MLNQECRGGEEGIVNEKQNKNKTQEGSEVSYLRKTDSMRISKDVVKNL